MKTIIIIFLLLACGAVGAVAWTHGNPCSTGAGFLVTADGTCTNVLTTGGADPLTP